MEITVWQVFFMLLTIIPASKMLSSIFMKLIARVGTVDEEKWAAIGLGSLGGLMGMYAMGKMASQSFGKRFPNIESTVPMPEGPGTTGPGSPDINAGGSGIGDIISGAQGAGGFAAKAGFGMGSLASVATPEVAPAVGGIMGAAARTVAMPAAVAYGIGKTMYQGVRGREDMSVMDAMGATARKMTGAQSTSEATARLLGTVLGSPLGAWGAEKSGNMFGAVTRWANDPLGTGGGLPDMGLNSEMFASSPTDQSQTAQSSVDNQVVRDALGRN